MVNPYSANDMVRWTICLGNERTADIRTAVVGDTHTHTHTLSAHIHENITQAYRVPLNAVQDGEPFLGVCLSVCAGAQSSNKWIQSLDNLHVSLKAPCPCCDIIYECHNWESVNCRSSPLSVAPCVNTKVQGDRVDQYTETGAIRWIYSPVTREPWNDAAVAFSELLHGSAVLLASICQTCTLLIHWGIVCACYCFGG